MMSLIGPVQPPDPALVRTRFAPGRKQAGQPPSLLRLQGGGGELVQTLLCR